MLKTHAFIKMDDSMKETKNEQNGFSVNHTTINTS